MACTTTAMGYLIIHQYIWCHTKCIPYSVQVHIQASMTHAEQEMFGNVMWTDVAAACVCVYESSKPVWFLSPT